MTNEFIPGQRWISLTEHHLGLGIIVELSGRQVTISFPAADEQRTYAIDNAPLNRVRFHVGDSISSLEGEALTVTDIHEDDGLLVYACLNKESHQVVLDELELDSFIQFSTPLDRLLSGQIDRGSALQLRVETLEHLQELDQSEVSGLLGARTSLLPHQIYIAHEVGRRHAPRVLLADEVGLGKTIEAGLIIHQQLYTSQAQRVLILVPDSLVHQWFVEMLRRFNLHFSIFDDERIAATELETNPFETEQLILCPLSLLSDNPDIASVASAAQWDLLVVDEAHHLEWSPTQPSTAYSCVEALSAKSKSVLLLTATPEQVGIESHFARLRLLDPDRFFDLEAFKQQESSYQPLNELLEQLLACEPTTITSNTTLMDALGGYINATQLDDILQNKPNPVEDITAQLLDRHGTSRVLFRNTRAAIPNFPARAAHHYPLEQPAQYAHLSGEQQLTPEYFYQDDDWVLFDPRVNWLTEQLKLLRPEKVLVICAKAQSAIALEQHLRLKSGFRSAVFHENTTLIERDRAAAYFADEDEGAQVLICSEIGSEGRNFQFSHHLVLFDLPLNPDLIEQRIGRLDRIGQRNTINIHLPFIQGSAQEVLFRWYHQGLNLLEKSCGAGTAIYENFADELNKQITQPDAELNQLIEKTALFAEQTHKKLQQGRDKLLELNSCRSDIAEDIIYQIQQNEGRETLNQYMGKVFDHFGIDQEYHSPQAWIIRPGDHMLASHFPGLPEDGITVTFDRNTALRREDMAYLSWEHPMVKGAMELVLSPDFGNTAMATISVKGLPEGTLLTEAVYTATYIAPASLQLQRFLPTTPIRVLVDIKGRDVSNALPHDGLNKLCAKIPKATAQAIVKQHHGEIRKLGKLAEELAHKQLPEIELQAQKKLAELMNSEIDRLVALQKVNANVRQEEIEHLQQQLADSQHCLSHSQLELQTIRLIINA